jgi:sulfur relay (sulfurtransferase) DsrF/TusC family protein
MASYLLIESCDPFESQDVQRTYALAAGLSTRAESVALFLVENGVFPTRESAASQRLVDLAEKGVAIQADDFSLRERGIDENRLVPAVKPVSLEAIVEHLERGHKVL